MFDGLNFGGLMKKAQDMQKKISRVHDELKERVVEANAGGGMVSVKVNGVQEVLDIQIAAEVLEGGDRDMLQDLLIAAINEGLKKSRRLMDSEMAKVTGSLGLPSGLFK
jgi:hypothetical protein